MMDFACQIQFKIADWQASCSRFATRENWQIWSNDANAFANAPEYKPALAFLPALQRRRLGKTARLMCDAAWDLTEKFPDCPIIYASHDGELNRSFELWLDLLRTNTVSPTSFGLSVHNALAGQFSLLRGDMHENTALAFSDVESAFTEAYAMLLDGAKSVLLIIADDPLSEEYDLNATRVPFAYALAMVLMAGDEFQLSLEHRAVDDTLRGELNPHFKQPENIIQNNNIEPYWGALDWIRFMLSGSLKHTQHYENRVWHWQKNHA